MSKPGDVVEFRAGQFGLDPPRNLAIFLDRWRKKGIPWVRVLTLEGTKELRADRLTKREFRTKLASIKDLDDAKARLADFVKQHAEGNLAEQATDDLGDLEGQLWQAVCERGPLSEEEIAAAYWGEPSPQQMRDTQAALARCRRPGVGRFEAGDKGNVWRAWTGDELEQIRDAWSRLEELRKRLVVRREGEEGWEFDRRPWAEAAGDDPDLLQWIQAAMVQFIEHDGVPDRDVAGIAGLGITNAWGMDLHRILGFMAQDWIDTPPTTRSSDYVHFLLQSGLWTPDEAVDSLMRRHVNQEPDFSHTPDEAAQAAAQEFGEPTMEPGREDLRHLECYTIDPPDARDFDDAVGLEATPNGTNLWVHIADVSHYVRQGTVLDRHAKRRATSVYLPGRVLPMLPPRLADHLCSLRDDGDRYALSLCLGIEAGRVVSHRAVRSLIRVNQNLSYADALERASSGQEPFASLLQLAKDIRAHRTGLDLDLGERRVALADGGFEIHLKRADEATRMIETFMVAANEAVAQLLHDNEVPALYRCHPLPEPDKVRRYEGQLRSMGYDVAMPLPRKAASDTGQSLLDALKAGGSIGLGFGAPEKAPEPEPELEDTGFAALPEEERQQWLTPFRDALAALPSDERGELAVGKMLGCMPQAYYSPENEGHFGLGLTHYAHFTSPIRRYPDLVVHRNLAWLVGGREGPMPHPAEDLRRLCDHCSSQERSAESLERRVKAACLVLAGREQGHGRCRVSGITPGSLWLKFSDGVEARAPLRELPGAPYEVDEHESMLFVSARSDDERWDAQDSASLGQWTDEETGQTFQVRARLGDVVSARATGRNVADGRTDAVVDRWR